MVQKQICEYEDVMSQFRSNARENIIISSEPMNISHPDSSSALISSTPISNPPHIQVRKTGLLNDVDHTTSQHNSLGKEHRRRTCLLNDVSNSSVDRITSRRKSGGPYERKGTEISRSKSLAPGKVHPTIKRIIAFKLKNERPHNILNLILMDRSTKQVLSFDELTFDELNDVKRCVNDPKIFPKIQDQLKKASVAEETRNILRTLFRRDIF